MLFFILFGGKLFRISKTLGSVMLDSGLFTPQLNENMTVFNLSEQDVKSYFTLATNKQVHHFVQFMSNTDRHRITMELFIS